MEQLNVDQLIKDIKDTASAILNKDIATIRGFSERQVNGIANLAGLIATGIAVGQINDVNRDFFLDQLVELSRNFVNTLIGLTMSTIEKLWNAIVNVIWETISKVTGIVLPGFTAL